MVPLSTPPNVRVPSAVVVAVTIAAMPIVASAPAVVAMAMASARSVLIRARRAILAGS